MKTMSFRLQRFTVCDCRFGFSSLLSRWHVGASGCCSEWSECAVLYWHISRQEQSVPCNEHNSDVESMAASTLLQGNNVTIIATDAMRVRNLREIRCNTSIASR